MSRAYWLNRNKILEKQVDAVENKLARSVKRKYNSVMSEVKKDIASFYQEYATQEGLTLKNAKKLLNKTELSDFHERITALKKQIKLTNNPELVRKMNAMQSRSKIQRLEALYMDLETKVSQLGQYEQMKLTDYIIDTADDAAKFAFDTAQTQTKITTTFSSLSDNAVKAILDYPFYNGQNYSATIWNNRDFLAKATQRTVMQGIVQGDSYSTMTKALQKRMDSNYYNTYRLIRTETTFTVQQAKKIGFEKAGLKKYEYVAIDDERSSDDYDELNGKIFLLKDAQPGVNFPPMRPNCRCDTIGYFKD